jgi:hypothetical protein
MPREGDSSPLRAILMTVAAMIFGMLPMAIGFGEGDLNRCRLAVPSSVVSSYPHSQRTGRYARPDLKKDTLSSVL